MTQILRYRITVQLNVKIQHPKQRHLSLITPLTVRMYVYRLLCIHTMPKLAKSTQDKAKRHCATKSMSPWKTTHTHTKKPSHPKLHRHHVMARKRVTRCRKRATISKRALVQCRRKTAGVVSIRSFQNCFLKISRQRATAWHGEKLSCAKVMSKIGRAAVCCPSCELAGLL